MNTTTTGDQSKPAVASSGTTGSFTVAWVGGDSSGTGIYAKRYSVAGTPLG